MNIDCRIIGDLLPLYADGTCSSESRALVDEHLAACPGCQKALQRMQSERFALTHPPLDTPKLADYALTVKKRQHGSDARRHPFDRAALTCGSFMAPPHTGSAPLRPRNRRKYL